MFLVAFAYRKAQLARSDSRVFWRFLETSNACLTVGPFQGSYDLRKELKDSVPGHW